MSKKTELRADLNRIGYQLGGAHLTQEARRATFSSFAHAMGEKGYGIQTAEQIGGKHLQAFVECRAGQGVSNRTIANEMSHIRAVLIHCAKEGLARNPAYSNKALGIGGGSRIGTKQPLSDAAIRGFQEQMDRLGRSALGNVLELQRALGLREAEAIRGGNPETLARWRRELQGRGYVRVIEGTKGGHPRDVRPADLNRARAAMERAQATLKASDQRYLVTRADGTAATGLKRALGIHRNVCHRAGIQSHGARYAFAQERTQAYRHPMRGGECIAQLRASRSVLCRRAVVHARGEWQEHEIVQLKSFLRDRVARSWQHADECVMQLAAQLRRDPQSIREKAVELGLGASVDAARWSRRHAKSASAPR
jgi:Integrase/Phage integrase, N-terminal